MFEDLLTFPPSFRDYKQVHLAPMSRFMRGLSISIELFKDALLPRRKRGIYHSMEISLDQDDRKLALLFSAGQAFDEFIHHRYHLIILGKTIVALF